MFITGYLKKCGYYLSTSFQFCVLSKSKTKEHMADGELALQPTGNRSWLWGLLRWSASDFGMLRAAEKKILSYLKTAYRGTYVKIGGAVEESDKLWTISLNVESKKAPILLLHGLASGVALWVLNLDSFAASRPVYAIDVLGFGRSSRPTFSSDAMEAEKQLVQSVEEWRKEMNLDKIILLGHSMGGFLAASYAIRYPDRVKHLILADPWGFPEKPDDISQRYNIPIWVKAIAYLVQPFNPLWGVRAAGPFGQWLIEKARPDIIRKFAPLLKEDIGMVPQYIFQCNAQKPSGESAFHAMMTGFGWAKNPIIKRMDTLRPDIPITLIYGSRSWVDNSAGEKIKELRSETSYVNVIVITGAGHHVYADRSEIFNKCVNEACALADANADVKSLNKNPIEYEEKSKPTLNEKDVSQDDGSGTKGELIINNDKNKLETGVEPAKNS